MHHQPQLSRTRPAPAARATVLLALTALLAAVLTALAPGARAAAPAATAVPGAAWVRAAHLVPGLEAMDVVAQGPEGTAPVQLAAAAGYGDVAPYQRLAPGTYTAQVRPAGAAASTEPVLSATFTAEAGKAYTLAGLGSLESPRLATLTDDLTPPAAGQVRVRVLPAASRAEQVDVTAVDGPVVADGAAFGQPTGYTAVPAGRWTLRVSADGVPASTVDVDLPAGGVHTVVVVDDGDRLGVRAVTDAAGAAATPVGGAATGGGGTAAHHVGTAPAPVLPLAAGGAVLLAGLVLLARRRTRTA